MPLWFQLSSSAGYKYEPESVFNRARLFLLLQATYVAYHDDDVLNTARERIRIESAAPTNYITNLGQRKSGCHFPSS